QTIHKTFIRVFLFSLFSLYLSLSLSLLSLFLSLSLSLSLSLLSLSPFLSFFHSFSFFFCYSQYLTNNTTFFFVLCSTVSHTSLFLHFSRILPHHLFPLVSAKN